MADDDIDALVDEWGEGNVSAAFALQQHIKDDGLDGIHYMDKARGRLESTGRLTVQKTIEGEMDSEY